MACIMECHTQISIKYMACIMECHTRISIKYMSGVNYNLISRLLFIEIFIYIIYIRYVSKLSYFQLESVHLFCHSRGGIHDASCIPGTL